MNGYHEFVFDQETRTFRGKFEEMYQAELSENFDSWGQDDMQRLDLWITRSLIETRNPTRIVDIGSGKGLLTSVVKQPGRSIIGCDVSETAIATARLRNPEISYVGLPDDSVESLQQFIAAAHQELGVIDVVMMSQVLSYIKEWVRLVDIVFTYSSGVCISLYLPEDPIGYVKSWSELCDVVSAHGTMTSSLWDSTNRTGYLLATR